MFGKFTWVYFQSIPHPRGTHPWHANESQRAMVAARIATLPLGANQYQKAEGAQICAPSQPEAADLLNVGVPKARAPTTPRGERPNR